MRHLIALAGMAALVAASPLSARDEEGRAAGAELPASIQCAPYARQVSGIQLFGAARDWWGQARGRYSTGNQPRVGAVMAFPAQRSMSGGHVAMVSRILDSRRVLLDHANWSPINGRRGQVERGVLAIDVSSAGDWSQVKVWYAPIGDVGTTEWTVSGFIYGDRAPDGTRSPDRTVRTTALPPVQAEPSKSFLKAFAKFE